VTGIGRSSANSHPSGTPAAMIRRTTPETGGEADHDGPSDLAPEPTTGATARYAFGTASLFAASTLLGLVLWASVLAVAPGWMQHALTSDSMAPSIQRGDVVLTAPTPVETLEPPNVVAFTDPGHGDHVVHRIVDRNDDGTFVTRGDANASADSTPLEPERIEGIGRILVPWVGFPAVWMTEGRLGLVGAAAALVLLVGWGSRFALLDRYDPWLPAPEPSGRARAKERRRTVMAVFSSVLVMLAGPALGAFAAHAAAGSAWGTGFWIDTPENLTVTATDRTSLDLAWDPVTNGEEYVLRWSVDGAAWTVMDPVVATEGAISGLAVDTTYQVQVRAQNANAESDWSDSVTATTDPITYVHTASVDTNSRTLDTLDGTLSGSAFTTHTNQLYAVAVDAEGNVYTADTGGRVIKRAPGGAIRWNVVFNNGINGVAVDAAGFVYTAGTDGRVRKLRPADGSAVWTVRPSENNTYGIAVDADGFVYVGDSNRFVRKLNSNGTEVWNRREHSLGVYEIAVDASGTVYSASADGTIRSRSSTGAVGWTFSGHSGTTYGIAVDGQGHIYSGGSDGTVRKLDATTGAQQWSRASGSPTVYGVAADPHGNVYVSGSDGGVRKLSPAGTQLWSELHHTQPVIRVAVDPGTFTVAGHGGGSTVSAFSSSASLEPFVDAEDPDEADELSTPEEPSGADEDPGGAVLSPPGDLTVGETTATSVELTWSGVDGAEDYEVRWLTEERDTWSQGPSTAETSVVVPELDPGTHHEFQVRTRDGERTSDWSETAVATTEDAPEAVDALEPDESDESEEAPEGPDPLAAPEGLLVLDTTSTSLDLAWDAVDGAEDYEVAWRFHREDPWSEAGDAWIEGEDTWSEGVDAEASWMIEGLEPETTYDLRVRAVGAEGAGPWSASVDATTERLETPGDVAVLGVSSATIDLAWDMVAAADGYRVRWREVGTDHWWESELTSSTAVTVEGLDPETAYELGVRAERGGAIGDWSPTVTAVTAAGDTPSTATSAGGPTLAATDPRQARRRSGCRR
jgi:signal peptidase I